MSDLIERLNQASNKNRHTSIGVLWNLCDEAADEIERLQAIVNLAQMLIQQTATGIQLVGHERFRTTLLQAVRGMNYHDPRNTEIERLQAENQRLRQRQGLLDLRTSRSGK